MPIPSPSFFTRKSQSANQNQQTNQNQQNKPPSPATMTLEELYTPFYEKTATNIYEKTLRAPIRLKLLDKFGVGRSGLFRSKELNEFRQKLKDEARVQAREDVASTLNTSFSETEKLTKAKHAMSANASVYTDAKSSVDTIMGQESDKIIQQVLPNSAVVPLLKAAAKSAFRESDPPAKRDASIIEQAQKRADELYKPLETEAVDKARFIIKGNKDEASKQATLSQISSDVKSDVSKKEIGKNAVQASIEAPSFDSAITKIAPLIKQVVPYNGDSAELSLEIKIPVAPNGFISIHLGTTAEHDDDHYQLGVEANIGAGGTVKVAELKGSIGLFIEAKGSSEIAALNLMSYGMYRHMYTTFPSIATTLWGQGGKTGYSKLEEAEIWAAVMEQYLINDEESEVSVGQQAAFDASVETGIYEGEFQLKGQRTTTYNKENLEGLNDDAHITKQVNKLNTSSLPTRVLETIGLKTADPNKKVYSKADIPMMTFGNDIDLGYIVAQQQLLGNGQNAAALKDAGKTNLERRSKRYNEIEAHKSLSVSTDHKLKLPHGEIELGAGFTLSSSTISGEISFGFPEELKKLGGEEVFNTLFPKLSSITNSAMQMLVHNSDESIKGVNEFEGTKALTANAIQEIISAQELDGAFEDLYGTTIKGTLGLEYDLKENKLEIAFKLSKDTSSEMKYENKLDLEVVNFSYNKSSKIFEVKKEISFGSQTSNTTP